MTLEELKNATLTEGGNPLKRLGRRISWAIVKPYFRRLLDTDNAGRTPSDTQMRTQAYELLAVTSRLATIEDQLAALEARLAEIEKRERQ